MIRVPDRRDAVGSVPAHHQTCLFAPRPDDCVLSAETAMLREHVSSKGANGGAFFFVGVDGPRSENRLRPSPRRCDIRPAVTLWVFPIPASPLERITEEGHTPMITATDYELPGMTWAEAKPAADAGLFALIDELRECEKRRDHFLDRILIGEDDQIETAAKKACDAARAIYERIAATKPTTPVGVLRQLELAANGWIAPSTVPIAMAGLREIGRRPPPLKVGRLPPVRRGCPLS
jgi:hypothetical protein